MGSVRYLLPFNDMLGGGLCTTTESEAVIYLEEVCQLLFFNREDVALLRDGIRLSPEW